MPKKCLIIWGKRTFEAEKTTSDFDRKKLNEDIITSEYNPSHKYFITGRQTDGRIWFSYAQLNREKAEKKAREMKNKYDCKIVHWV